MSLDPPVLIWCIAVPGLTMLLALWGTRWLTGSSSTAPSCVANIVLAFGYWVAVAIAAYGMGHLQSEQTSFWPEDAWPRVLAPMLLVVLLAGTLSPLRVLSAEAVWISLAVISVGASLLVMPTGDGWVDTLPLHRFWMAAIAISTILNSFLLHEIFTRGASRWLPLILLAHLACAAIIGASAYGALFEWCLAAIVVTAATSLFSATGWIANSFAIVFTSVLFAASMIAAGRFYSYAEITPVAYGVALFAPTLIAAGDLFLHKRAVWIRVAASAVFATVIVSSVAYWFLVA